MKENLALLKEYGVQVMRWQTAVFAGDGSANAIGDQLRRLEAEILRRMNA